MALPSIFELVFVFVLSGLLTQAEREAAVEAHSKEVIACANDLTRATVDATTAAGAFKITANELFADRSDLALEGARKHIEKLKLMLKGRPERLKDVIALEKLINDLVKVVNNLKSPESENADLPSLANLIGRGRQFQSINRLVNQLGIVTNSVIAEELKLELQTPKQRARTREQIKRVLFGGVLFNIVLAFMLASYFSRSVTKRLLIVRENTERLAKRQKLVPAIGGVDEISDLDAAFHKAAARLEELEQFKKQLIGIVSHELKTPLSSMQVNLALMSSGVTGELSEKAQKKVRVLESNTIRLIRLINDLLDVEKMEAGKFELLLRDCNLSEIIRVSLESVAEFAEKRHVKLQSVDTELVLNVDQDRVVQVLINFLSNAIKYSPENSIVEVEVVVVEDVTEVRVKDQGRGVPDSHVAKIFDKFQQVDKSDETEKGGTGLGLAIAKAIIEEHGGTIGVISKLGEGSTFWFRLKNSAETMRISSEPLK